MKTHVKLKIYERIQKDEQYKTRLLMTKNRKNTNKPENVSRKVPRMGAVLPGWFPPVDPKRRQLRFDGSSGRLLAPQSHPEVEKWPIPNETMIK